MIGKLNKLIEEYKQIADNLDTSKADWAMDSSDWLDYGKSIGITEVLDELRKIVDGVR